MVHTDLKFFTNEPERDLYSRFAAILKSNTQFFDILVGYFRASGFFKMYKNQLLPSCITYKLKLYVCNIRHIFSISC